MTGANAFAAAERLNRLRNACGCSQGALAMTVGFLTVGTAVVLRYGAWTLAGLERMPLAFVAAVLAMGVGKTIGIAMARYGARQHISMLTRAYARPA